MLLANVLCTLALAPTEPLKTISTTVWAPWASDPALEAAALIHEAHGAARLAAYWRSWSELPAGSNTTLRRVLAAAEPLLPSIAYRALRVALAARLEAPRVEMWSEVATATAEALSPNDDAGRTGETVACWAIACGELHASVAVAIDAAAQDGCAAAAAAAEATHPVLGPLAVADHTVVERAVEAGGADGGRVLVYADVHAAGLGACLAAIERSGGVAVSLRYRPSAERGVALQGFAAELAIKSDEYKTIDDRKAAAGSAADDGGGDDDDEGGEGGEGGAGLEERPSWLLRRHAEEPIGPEALPTERLQTLPMQAALAVLRSKRPLATLRDVAGNLPSLARHLSRTSLDGRDGKAPELRRALEEPRRVAKLRSAVAQNGGGVLTINGRPLPLPPPSAEASSSSSPMGMGMGMGMGDGDGDGDGGGQGRPDAFFALLRAVHEEAARAARLTALGVPAAAAQELLATTPPIEPVRVDVRGLSDVPSLLWLNDLGAGETYKEWSADAVDTARPGYRSLQFTRHPYFTALVVADVGTARGAALAGYAAQLCRRDAPLHVALLPTRDATAATASIASTASTAEADAATDAMATATATATDVAASADVGGKLLLGVNATAGRAALLNLLRRLEQGVTTKKGSGGGGGSVAVAPGRLSLEALRTAHADAVLSAAAGGGGSGKKKKKGKKGGKLGKVEKLH